MCDVCIIICTYCSSLITRAGALTAFSFPRSSPMTCCGLSGVGAGMVIFTHISPPKLDEPDGFPAHEYLFMSIYFCIDITIYLLCILA